MYRADLQKLSRLRIRETKVLLNAKLFAGAYHVAGFAVECGLKACVAKNVSRYQFPDKKIASKVFTHDVTDLVKIAGLSGELDFERKNSAIFDTNWSVVAKWTPENRYELSTTKQEAEGLYKAIASRKYGVLKWIRNHW